MAQKKRNKKSGKSLKVVLPIVAAVLLLVGAGVYVVWMLWAVPRYLPAFEVNDTAGYVKIADTTTVDGLMAQVEEHLHPKWPSSVRMTLKREMQGRKLVPGFYRFTNTNTAIFFARSVTRGWQSPWKLTVSGSIRSLDTLCARISNQMLVSRRELLDKFDDPAVMAKHGVKARQEWFAKILPDTYEMYWSASAEEIIERLCLENDNFWSPERRSLARAQGITPRQAVVLASIVAEETAAKQEYAKIASVYLNRLEKGMKLQSDPTINYIYGFTLKRILLRHLQTESPYNTYMHEGLPPNPICLPSKAHIEAVLHPDATKYLYFCASPKLNGRHEFATSYSDHLKNANEFHHALDSLAAVRRMAAAQTEQDKEGGNE